RVLGMRMDHSVDFRPCLVDRRMNETLQIGRAVVVADNFSLEREFQNIRRVDELRAARARQKKAIRSRRMPDAHMAIGIDDVLQGENAVGDDEILPDLIDFRHSFPSSKTRVSSASATFKL